MLRRIIGIIVLLLIAIVGVAIALNTRNALQRNHAVYLMNQGEWKQARAIVEQLVTRSPDERNSALLARIELNTGAFAEAATLLRELRPSEERSLELAICSYEMNREQEAAELFRASVNARGELNSTRQHLARVALDVLTTSNTVATPESPPDFREKVESMMWHSLLGQALYASGNYSDAAAEIQSAIDMGDTNAHVRMLGCAANAIEGRYPDAQRLADRAEDKFSFETLRAFLAGTHDRTTSVSISTDSAQRLAHLLGRFRRAEAWSLMRLGAQQNTTAPVAVAIASLAPATTESLELSAAMLRGEAFEQFGDYRSAYLCYSDVLARAPTYSALLRMRNLAGDSPQFKELQAEFLGDRSVVCYVPAGQIDSSQTLLRKDYHAFFTQATAVATLTVPESSEYYLNLVARGDPAFGLWPEVSITIDGQPTGTLYINREDWDCFWLRRRLEKGVHQMRIEYINNSERLRSNEEDRNFYLQSIIISKVVPE